MTNICMLNFIIDLIEEIFVVNYAANNFFQTSNKFSDFWQCIPSFYFVYTTQAQLGLSQF